VTYAWDSLCKSLEDKIVLMICFFHSRMEKLKFGKVPLPLSCGAAMFLSQVSSLELIEQSWPSQDSKG
jgi:hypothetical protein